MACLEIDTKWLPEVLDALYPAFWVEKEGLQASEVFEPALERVLGAEMAHDVVALVRHVPFPGVSMADTWYSIESFRRGARQTSPEHNRSSRVWGNRAAVVHLRELLGREGCVLGIRPLRSGTTFLAAAGDDPGTPLKQERSWNVKIDHFEAFS